MLHGLAAVLAAVVHHAIAVFKALGRCYLCNGLEAFSDQCGVRGIDLVRAADVLPGEHEDVHGSLRINVAEGINILIIINLR